MGTILINGIHYYKINEDLHDPDRYVRTFVPEFERASDRLCDAIGLTVRQQTDHLDPNSFSACVACSTGLSATYVELEKYNSRFRERVHLESGIEPSLFVTGYECANWGYLLRYFHTPGVRQRILVLILDVNSPYLEASKYNPAWEKSGFGLGILDLSLEPGPDGDLLTSHTTTENGYFEYLKGVKTFADRHPDALVSMPFFPASQRRALRQTFGPRALPVLHDEFGHCFGSDPWIGLARHLATDPSARGGDVVASSFALGGYYCAARMTLSPDIRYSISDSLWADAPIAAAGVAAPS